MKKRRNPRTSYRLLLLRCTRHRDFT